MKKILSSALFLLLLSGFSATAFAGFGLTPADPNQRQFSFELKPGEEITDSVLVENIAQEPVTINLYAADGTQSNQGTFALTTLATGQKHIGTWVKFNKATVTLEPGERKEMPFTIKMPENATPGVYGGGIAAEAGSTVTDGGAQAADQTQQTGNAVSITSRVVVKLFVSIPGQKISLVDWTGFTYTPGDNGNRGSFKLTYDNSGNTVVIAEQKIEVKGFPPSGDQIFELPVATILQGSSIEIPVKWENEPFVGLYKATASATFYEYDIIKNAKGASRFFSKEIDIFIPLKINTAAGKITVAVAILIGLLLATFIIKLLSNWQFKRHAHPYVVQQGETLVSIAEKCHVSWKKLAKINKLKPPYNLKPGQKILAPP